MSEAVHADKQTGQPQCAQDGWDSAGPVFLWSGCGPCCAISESEQREFIRGVGCVALLCALLAVPVLASVAASPQPADNTPTTVQAKA
jgi:hypothetical protein